MSPPQYSPSRNLKLYIVRMSIFETSTLDKRWRRRGDSNSRAGCPTYRFSRPDPSATWVLLHIITDVVFRDAPDSHALSLPNRANVLYPPDHEHFRSTFRRVVCSDLLTNWGLYFTSLLQPSKLLTITLG